MWRCGCHRQMLIEMGAVAVIDRIRGVGEGGADLVVSGVRRLISEMT